MRILHSSDWHLGQHFMGKSRQAEHQAFLAWLLEQVTAQAVDVVLVAGDIFDTGAPPSYARELYNQFVVSMRDSGAALVVLAGNHDSVATLGESRSLLARLGTRVIASVADDPADQVLLLHRRDGSVGAVLCAIPFIRARDVLQSAAGQSAQEKQLALQSAIQAHYRQVYAVACEQRNTHAQALPIIATGHLTTVGASASDSVREIYVGALEAFPTSAFPPADYIALGHIHRPQQVGGLAHIRYSGSPIALSFDESRQRKEVLLVDFAEGALAAVTALAVPCFQPMASVRGSLAQLPALLAEAAAQATAQRPAWLDIEVHSDDYLSDLQTPLAELLRGLPLEILRTRRARGTASAQLSATARRTLDELTPQEVFAHRLDAEAFEPDVQERLQALHAQVLAGLREESA
jgi:exonuclease SbcD